MVETFWQKSADGNSEEGLVSCDTFVVMSDATVSGEVSLTITSLIPWLYRLHLDHIWQELGPSQW